MGTSQLLSVPYSLFSDNGVPDGQNPGDMLYWDGTQWIKVSAGQNGQVLTFNDGVPVWGGVQLPIINTNAITNINAFTAYGGGNIASDGGSPVIARGLCWNNAPNPTTANFKTTNGSGAGSFNANLNALAASTLYFVRAYSTNSAGTSYGNEVSFTTANGSASLSTTAVTAITANSATSGGNITNSGGASITMRGVCWNTSPFPTIANSKTTNGPGNGVFVSELTSLVANTVYYVRAYATNSLGTSYGQQLSFTTQNGIITLTTAEVTEITATTAISGGEITSDGGSTVTARGICWSISQNPTITDSTTNDGSGNGVFVSNLTGLLPDTLYYVRCYATNGVGTFYGNEVSFATLPEIVWECGDTIVDTRDNQKYATVQIGTQCWMAQNLNVGTRIEGVQNPSNNGTIEKYCYDNSISNCGVYGGLYQWDEMMSYDAVEGGQGICLSGWHVPTDTDWTSLKNFLGGDSIAGGKMKETGILHWLLPNVGATNNSGFTGLPASGRSPNGGFGSLGEYAFFWSSSWVNGYYKWCWYLTSNDSEVNRGSSDKSHGFSLRCLNNENTVSQLIIYPLNQEVTATEGTTAFEVTSNTSWAVEESVSWLIVSPMNGSSDGTLTVTFESNTSSESRIGQITITADGGNPVVNVTVTQEGVQLAIGDNYGGGKVAYFFQPSDPGYVVGEVHGLIAASSDQSIGAQWGCNGTTISGAEGTAIGTGNQNTIDIEAGCTTAGIAADICANLTLSSYSDWFLPSQDELNQLYVQRAAIGGFASYYYWSSSGYGSNDAWRQGFDDGHQNIVSKNIISYVRAVRAF